jgi:hypothetical protein
MWRNDLNLLQRKEGGHKLQWCEMHCELSLSQWMRSGGERITAC